jgi:putative ABC transport system permease protein
MPSLAGVALRNIARTPRRSAIVSAAVAGGCAALVFMMGMNNGLAELMVTNSVGLLLGHVQVDSATGQLTVPEGPVLAAADAAADAAGASGRLELAGIVRRPERSVGVRLLGLDADREARTSEFPHLLTEGRLPSADERRGAAVGVLLASEHGLQLGDILQVYYLIGADTAGSELLRVTGLFRTGSEDLDRQLVLVALPTAKRLSDVTGSARVVVKAIANARTGALAAELRGRLDPAVYRVRAWHEVSPFMKGMVAFQYGSINVVLLVLYLVVGAGVAAIQLLGVTGRTREFGVLSSIGFRPRDIVALVSLETLFLGLVAVATGLVLGAAIATLVSHLGGIDVRIVGGENLEALMGLDPHLRPVLNRRTFTFAAGLVAPVLLLGGVLPALRAARLTPMEALRRP